MDEHALQCQVVAAIRAGAVRGEQGVPFVAAVPNQLIRQSRIGTKVRAKREGLVSGFPDLILAYNGRMFCVELKSPSRAGRAETGLSDNQKTAIASLEERGVQTIVSKNYDDVLAAVACWVKQVDAK